MEALRQIVRIPRDHELKIRVPKNIPENETVEVILIIKERQKNFKQRINELKYASKDNKFLDDMQEISRDFENSGKCPPDNNQKAR
jgi:hypothetical protein